MKIAFIFVLYKTPKSEVERLKREIYDLGFKNKELIFVDNSKTKEGYAGGVNRGIRKASKDTEAYVICNPDISFRGIDGRKFLDGLRYFDILGYAMRQQGRVYYGGVIDRWRLSGGLIQSRPKKRFQEVDFVTGSLMIVKREVIDKIGFMDESYFMYYEDVDYSYRARQAGLRVGIDSTVTYEHFELSQGSQLKNNHLRKNRLKFLLRYGSLAQKIYEFIRLPKTLYEESKYIFNFLSLNFSSLFSKALNFALFLFLVRILTTADYGIYTLVWAHVGLLAPLADLGTTTYGMIYQGTEKTKHISHVFSLRVILSVIVLILTLGAAYIFGYQPNILVLIALTLPVILANMASGTLLIHYSRAEELYRASL